MQRQPSSSSSDGAIGTAALEEKDRELRMARARIMDLEGQLRAAAASQQEDVDDECDAEVGLPMEPANPGTHGMCIWSWGELICRHADVCMCLIRIPMK